MKNIFKYLKGITLFFFLLIGLGCDEYELEINVIKATSIEVTNASDGYIVLSNRETATIEFRILPEDATLQIASFESMDEELFTVDDTGLITPKGGVGEAEVIVRTKDDSGAKTSVMVYVYEQPVSVESIEILYLQNEIQYAVVDEEIQVEVQVLPLYATDKSLTYDSDDKTIFIVSETGLITGVSVGTATLTITSVSDPDISVSCIVEVLSAGVDVQDIQLNVYQKNVLLRETFKLEATVSPVDATYQRLEYSSSDESIATVDSEGIVTPLSSGTVTITVFATDKSGVTSSCDVTIDNWYYMANWSVTTNTVDNEGGGEYAILNTDNDVNSYWVNAWGSPINFPHWLLVDMQEERYVDILQLHRRWHWNGGGYLADVRTAEVYYGTTISSNWSEPEVSGLTLAGIVDFGYNSDPAGIPEENADFYQKIDASARYILISFTASNRDLNTNMSWIKVYGK